MLVVSDTSPLSNLALIGRLSLLRDQFGEVCLPPAVARELDALREPAARTALAHAIHVGWLREMLLPPSAPFPSELRGLDAGETEALRLALALSADHVLIDEREGRQRAARLGLHAIGVLGVLPAAKDAGAIDSRRAEIDSLRRVAGFFVDRALEARVLALAGEESGGGERPGP